MDDTYLEYSFSINPLQPATDILLAELGELAFDSFVETETGLLAYIKKRDWYEGLLKAVRVLKHPDFTIEYSTKEIGQQNWNAQWEQNFEPIRIDDRCLVRAPFHEAVRDVQYDLVISPKMSFGTGHHETTQMMLEHLLEVELRGKSVLDMGCGTGVLAILAALRGASQVDAVDIDHWSFLNARENTILNDQAHIHVYEGDVSFLKDQKYHLILANINRNILMKDIPVYVRHLEENGMLILSGFYQDDLSQISEICAETGLKYLRKSIKNNWVAAVYRIS